MPAARQMRASACAAPADGWRKTIKSGDIASRLRAVSKSVSPFVTLEVEALMLMVSAERRLPANSKEVRVRVEGSKKRLMTVRPRRVGTFLISRCEMSRNVSAVSSTCTISALVNSRMPSKSLRARPVGARSSARCSSLSIFLRIRSPIQLQLIQKKATTQGRPRSFAFRRSLHDGDPFLAVNVIEHHLDDLALFRRHKLADVIRMNRQLTMLLAAIHEHGQLHTARAA